jgi:hypothetical protein
MTRSGDRAEQRGKRDEDNESWHYVSYLCSIVAWAAMLGVIARAQYVWIGKGFARLTKSIAGRGDGPAWRGAETRCRWIK